MPRSVGILLAVPLLAACSARSDRELLHRYLQANEATLKRDFKKELQDVPAEQRGYAYNGLQNRAQVATIDDFLADAPGLTASGREAVGSVRETCTAFAELFEAIVREGRSEYTQAERERANELLAEYQERLFRIGRMIDGKE